MGVLAQHVPSIEQLKPGLVEVIEEGGSKQFFRTRTNHRPYIFLLALATDEEQCRAALLLSSPDRS